MKRLCLLKIVLMFAPLIVFSSLFAGCLDSNSDGNESFPLSDFHSIKVSLQVDAIFEKNIENDSFTDIYPEKFEHAFFSYSTAEINGSITDKWNDNTYTASWDYNYWYDTTRKQGNMTLVFEKDGSSIVSICAMEKLTDINGRISTIEFASDHVSLYEPVSTDTFKMYSIRGIEVCLTIVDIDYIDIVPQSHPRITPGTETILSYDCDDFSLLTVSVMNTDG
jgi:hypothetical protein